MASAVLQSCAGLGTEVGCGRSILWQSGSGACKSEQRALCRDAHATQIEGATRV